MKIKHLKEIIVSIKDIVKYGGVTKIKVTEIPKANNLFSQDTVVLVTGGTRGIGKEIAKQFAEAGATVIATGRNVDHTQTKTITKNEESGGKILFLSWDISDVSCVETKLREAELLAGNEISILINNAGTYCTTHFPNCLPEDWDAVYSTNVKGAFFLTQAICKRWLKSSPRQSPRKIINIASQGGFVGANNPYRMTKWDLRGFTQFLGIAYSKKGIIANAIAPGIIVTDMQPQFQKQEDNYYTDHNPVHRLGLPLEIASLAIFLASDAANFIIGQTICCDGGYSLK